MNKIIETTAAYEITQLEEGVTPEALEMLRAFPNRLMTAKGAVYAVREVSMSKSGTLLVEMARVETL